MANRELVIKVSEELLEYFANHSCMSEDGWFSHSSKLLDAFRNATLLPEDHGRLGDLDALEEEMIGGINAGLMIDGYEDYSHINDTEDCLECVKYADTIIEAHHPAPVKEKSKSRDDDWER